MQVCSTVLGARCWLCIGVQGALRQWLSSTVAHRDSFFSLSPQWHSKEVRAVGFLPLATWTQPCGEVVGRSLLSSPPLLVQKESMEREFEELGGRRGLWVGNRGRSLSYLTDHLKQVRCSAPLYCYVRGFILIPILQREKLGFWEVTQLVQGDLGQVAKLGFKPMSFFISCTIFYQGKIYVQ